MENKKGLSAIVATLIIILLAIVAFGIVSVVVRNTVETGAENIELSSKCLEIEMHATKIVPGVGGNFDITFSRSDSGEMINGVKILLIDAAGENSISEELIKEIDPLAKFTETIPFTDGEGFAVAKVQVVPLFMKESGDLYPCEKSYTDELTPETA